MAGHRNPDMSLLALTAFLNAFNFPSGIEDLAISTAI